MARSNFDISNLSKEQLANPASYNACMRLAYHFTETKGKRNWVNFTRIKSHFYNQSKEGNLTVKDVNNLLQKKSLPTKVSQAIKAYIAQG